MTGNQKGVFFFAVGVAAGYHSTVIAVVTDGSSVTDAFGKTMTGTTKSPMFVYMEDIDGVTVMNKSELGDMLRNLIGHAFNYYRGSPVENKYYPNPTQDVSLKGQIWQLYKNPKETPRKSVSPSKKEEEWHWYNPSTW